MKAWLLLPLCLLASVRAELTEDRKVFLKKAAGKK